MLKRNKIQSQYNCDRAGKLKNEAIKITLKLMDADPINWKTFNDKINTLIFEEGKSIGLRATIKDLKNEEEVILEYFEGDNILHITTDRVVSNGTQMFLSEIKDIINDSSKNNFKQEDGSPVKINHMIIRGIKGEKLPIVIDSYHPAYFTRMLVMNLSCFVNTGKWYMNPSKTYR